ncbi:MAG: hypothetical protein A2Z99_08680 [Treponema sp. GWB1_62_6]|nr:MAG: hypothetical protein A2Z99_08680 [Treponema sp. GWB1_62_6]
MNKTRAVALALLGLVLVSIPVVDYLALPAWNLQSFALWMLAGVYLFLVSSLAFVAAGKPRAAFAAIPIGAIPVAASFILSAFSWVFWPGNDARFFRRLPVSERAADDFPRDFPGEGISADEKERLLLPALDKELSRTIAQGKLGPYGAQFQMDDTIFTSLSVLRDGKPRIIRVAPLDYSGSAVAISAGETGTAGYIEVDQETGEGKLAETKGGMKFTPGAILSRDLARRARFAYRTKLFGSWSFEIDDGGNPFWTIPTLRNSIGVFGGPVREGLVLVDAVNGAVAYYPAGTEPDWVDRSIPVDLVLSQANDYLGLKNGWGNYYFGARKDVFQLSDSYAYVVSNSSAGSRTWFVSGVTSPNEADQTLVGLMMVDLKSGEARRYPLSGITEMRAMDIAVNDERVRAQGLSASWPFLVDVDGIPAFAMILKNDLQRQRFAYVDVATGQKVSMGDTRGSARAQFVGLTGGDAEADERLVEYSGTVLRVKERPDEDAIQFMLAGDPFALYSVPARTTLGAYFLAPGDRIIFSYRESSSVRGMRFVVRLRNLTVGE